ncbi:hypothetical protein ACFL08_03410 [Patescibacteria group bacterium]
MSECEKVLGGIWIDGNRFFIVCDDSPMKLCDCLSVIFKVNNTYDYLTCENSEDNKGGHLKITGPESKIKEFLAEIRPVFCR